MSVNYKKGVYTLKEIGEIVFKKCPGRFKSVESAYAMAKSTATKLGIGDINGKKRCKYIAANDAQAIVEAIKRTRSKKGKRKGEVVQLSIFDKTAEEQLDWLDKYTPHVEKTPEPVALPVPHGMTPEQVDAIAAFWQAWKHLCEVLGNGEES